MLHVGTRRCRLVARSIWERSVAAASSAPVIDVKKPGTSPDGSVLSVLDNRETRSHRIYLKKKHEFARNRHGRLPMELWPAALKPLLMHTSPHPEDHVAESVFVRLADPKSPVDDYRRLFLTIYLQHKCTVQYFDPATSGGLILLHGFRPSRTKALNMLKNVFRTIEQLSVESSTMILESCKFKVRQYVNEPRAWIRDRRNKMLAEIELPKTMSIISFATYVKELVTSNPPRLKFRYFEGDHVDTAANYKEHIRQVSELLLALFDADRLAPCWSTEAMIDAIQYLGKYSRLPQQRRLISRLYASEAIQSAHVHEAMLEAAAQDDRLKAFTYCIGQMLAHQQKPTWLSWVHLVSLLKHWDLETAESVAELMRTKKIAASGEAQKAVLDRLAQLKYAQWMDNGGSSAAFLDLLSVQYPQVDRLSSGALLGILTWHAHRLDLAGIREFLRLHAERRSPVKLPAEIIEMFLKSAKRHASLPFALGTLELAAASNLGALPILNGGAYSALMDLAFHTRSINLFKVAWRYACMAGVATTQMQERMLDTLLSFPSGPLELASLRGHSSRYDRPHAALRNKLQRLALSEQLVDSPSRSSVSVSVNLEGPGNIEDRVDVQTSPDSTLSKPVNAAPIRRGVTPRPDRTMADIFRNVAGVLAVGLTWREVLRIRQQMVAEAEEKGRPKPTVAFQEHPTRQPRQQRIRLMEFDMELGYKFKPKLSLMRMIREAIAADRKLKRKRVAGSIEDLSRHCLKIAVNRRKTVDREAERDHVSKDGSTAAIGDGKGMEEVTEDRTQDGIGGLEEALEDFSEEDMDDVTAEGADEDTEQGKETRV